MAKNTRKAGRSTAASHASCDGDDGDEGHGGDDGDGEHGDDDGDGEHGDDSDEDWPENGHDDSATGDEVAPADIDEDEWWNQSVGSEDEVEEWRAADSDNDEGVDADGGQAEAAAGATGATGDDGAEANDEADVKARRMTVEAEAEADADAVAPADVVAIADADAAEGGADDDPWSITRDDDVPLLKRRLRHHLQSKPKRARVVLSDDDSPGEELPLRISAADKGKSKVVDAPAKATVRRRPSTKKRKNDGNPGSSTGAAKKKKKGRNKDDILVNEALGSDDDYAEAAGPIPLFPEKTKPKDPTLHNPNSRPTPPRSKDSKKRRRGWTVREKLKWARRYQESTASIACIRRWSAEAAAGRGQNARRAMLVLDSYRGHITQTILQSYRTHSITPAVTPAGCMSQIQPLDFSINRCFKAGVRARYARWFMREGIHLKMKKVPKQVIIDAFRHYGISSKLDGTEKHMVMSHLHARSTVKISEDMSLGGTTGDNTRLIGQAPEEEQEEEMQAEGEREVAMATGLEVLYQETPNYRGAAAEADRMIEPRETARHAWPVPDLGVDPSVSAAEEAVTEEG
ncbi:unnamed protein product [Closterium sp. NIES-65]|nr:unnamed protein product [Closterium sp. NIES-65]